MELPKPPASLLARHRQLSPNASVRVSPLCLGTMTFGDGHQEKYGQITKKDAWDIMDTFYKQGGNFFDTANGYQDGQSEEWVGEWIAERGVRDEIVLATKYSSPFMGAHPGKIQSNFVGNGAKSLRLSVESSLKRLKTDYIDLLYLHWWDYSTSIAEVMLALNDLVKSGKVLYLGISDAPAWIVSACNQYARDHGLRQFAVYQGNWSAALRDFERDIIPMAAYEGMGLCPYGVLNQGRFQTEAGFEERAKNNTGRNFKPTNEHDKRVSAALEAIAEKKGDTKLLDVALAYCTQKTPYVFPIVGSRRVEHIQGSIDGLKVTLTEREIADVEEAYPFNHGFPHTFLSGTLFGKEDVQHKPANGPADVWLTRMSGCTFDWVERPKAIRPPAKQ